MLTKVLGMLDSHTHFHLWEESSGPQEKSLESAVSVSTTMADLYSRRWQTYLLHGFCQTPPLPPHQHRGWLFWSNWSKTRKVLLQKVWRDIYLYGKSCYSLHYVGTDACINTLRRFTSGRGQVQHLWSNNGTNFVRAERELKETLANLNQEAITGYLAQVGVKWTFNPPAGSHFGGVWERIICMVRRVLCSVLRQQTLEDDGLATVFCDDRSYRLITN